MQLGKALTNLSIRQGINGEQMARELHLDPTTVRNLKNDKRNVTTDTAHFSLQVYDDGEDASLRSDQSHQVWVFPSSGEK